MSVIVPPPEPAELPFARCLDRGEVETEGRWWWRQRGGGDRGGGGRDRGEVVVETGEVELKTEGRWW